MHPRGETRRSATYVGTVYGILSLSGTWAENQGSSTGFKYIIRLNKKIISISASPGSKASIGVKS